MRFSIVLKLVTPGYNYPQPFEYALAGYSSGATASARQSYYSRYGSTWTDLTAWRATANFCIKGYTLYPPPIAYNVTGGGAYCAGGSGVPVGLSGSEANVNYYLKRNATNAVETRAGTGSAINFINQTVAGTYTVVATNASAPSNWANMTGSAVVMLDPTPPVITCVSNKQVQCGSAWTFDEPSATDNCGSVAVTVVSTVTNMACAGTFAATRTWQAADASGNTATCSQIVTVVDTRPPVLTCPANIVKEFVDGGGATATFSGQATDVCSSVTLTFLPPSGSLFPIGTTTVAGRAEDACGNASTCSFEITVLGPLGVLQNVLAELMARRATVTNANDVLRLGQAIVPLSASVAGDWWEDETHLTGENGNRVFNENKECVKKLLLVLRDEPSEVPEAVVLDWIERIVRSDRLLTWVSLQEAAQAGLNPKKLAEDTRELARGDQEAAEGNPDNGIQCYWNAWRHAVRLQIQESLSANGILRLHFVGALNRTYQIQASTNLVDWVGLGAFRAQGDGVVEFIDADAVKHASRFYRVVEQ